MTSKLPPYTVAVAKDRFGREVIAIKRLQGHWDIVGADEDWFNSDEELYNRWPEVTIIGEGIWPDQNAG